MGARFDCDLFNAENLICKAFRLRHSLLELPGKPKNLVRNHCNGSHLHNDEWSDILLPSQWFYRFDGEEGKRTIFRPGKAPTSDGKGPVITRFYCGKEEMTLGEIAKVIKEKDNSMFKTSGNLNDDEFSSLHQNPAFAPAFREPDKLGTLRQNFNYKLSFDPKFKAFILNSESGKIKHLLEKVRGKLRNIVEADGDIVQV